MNWDTVNFDWNHIRAFLVTAEKGTLSAAATALNLTQPTLSRQVQALEKALQVSLFERVGQRLSLTDSGIALLEHAKAMGNDALAFSLTANGKTTQIEGTVIISVAELTAFYHMPTIIKKLRKLEPGITLEIVVTNEASDLKRREADIAIRNFHPKQPDLIAKKVGNEPIWLYGYKQYLSRLSDAEMCLKATGINILGFDRSKSVIDILNKENWHLTPKNFPIITSFQLLQLELCKQGLGLILFPEQMGDLESELEKAFEFKGAIMTLPVWLVCHQELRTSLRVKRVFDFIAHEMQTFYQYG